MLEVVLNLRENLYCIAPVKTFFYRWGEAKASWSHLVQIFKFLMSFCWCHVPLMVQIWNLCDHPVLSFLKTVVIHAKHVYMMMSEHNWLGWKMANLKTILKSGLWLPKCKLRSAPSIKFTCHSQSVQVFMQLIVWSDSHHAQFSALDDLPKWTIINE